MDPHYSVLLGDDNIQNGGCPLTEDTNNNKNRKNKNISTLVVAIVVPVVVGLVIIIGLLVYFAPKYVNFFNFHIQLHI